MPVDMNIRYFYKKEETEHIIAFLEGLYKEGCSIYGRVTYKQPYKQGVLYPDKEWKTEFPRYTGALATLLSDKRIYGINLGLNDLDLKSGARGVMVSLYSRKDGKTNFHTLEISGEWYYDIFKEVTNPKPNEERIVQLMKTLYYKSNPLFAYLDVDEYHQATWIDYDKRQIEKFNRINFFNSEFVDGFGREKLLKAKLYRVEELDDGGVMTVAIPLGSKEDNINRPLGLSVEEVIR